MADLDLLTNIVLVIIAAGIGGIITWIFKRPESKIVIENARIEKADSERALAKELRQESLNEAINVRSETREHMSQLLNNLRSEIALAKSQEKGEDVVRDIKAEQLARDFNEFKSVQNAINEKTFKTIEFIHSVLLGPSAKSLPPYMTGEQETKEHKKAPDVGVFADRNEEDNIEKQ